MTFLDMSGANGASSRRPSAAVVAAFISVDPGDSPDALADRRAGLGGARYPFAIDPTGTLAAQYGIAALGKWRLRDHRLRAATG
jgi:hypothetical protein